MQPRLFPSGSPNDAGAAVDTARLVEQELRLALVPGLGPRLRARLLTQFGSIGRVLEATAAELRDVPGVGRTLSQAILAAGSLDVQQERELCRQHGIELLIQADARYPRLLREIPDPPSVLFSWGALLPSDALAVAIVGTRHPTAYGLHQAERLAGSLAQAGFLVVSGLARGIDAAAHRGAMAAGGRTLAVLGSGLLNIYPPDHGELAQQIRRQGVLLSELPPRRQPMSGTFPQRNRLISGLSLGVIVIEAALRSGALISARHAGEQGREVFALPGRVDSPVSRGCHRLIRDGARLLENLDDVLEELGPLVETISTADGWRVRHPAELQLNEQERTVLQAILSQPTSVDQLVAQTKLAVPQILATLSVLETRHLVRRISGTKVQRA